MCTIFQIPLFFKQNKIVFYSTILYVYVNFSLDFYFVNICIQKKERIEHKSTEKGIPKDALQHNK